MNKEDFTNDYGEIVSIETPEAIYGFFGKYRCLSNFHGIAFRYGKLTFQSSEAAYMSEKTLDPEIKLLFSECKSGADAKKLGKTIELRDEWDDVHRIHSMYRVLLAKFTQDTASMKILLSTGSKYLEETNWWGDQYWGKCNFKGTNHLGNVLMTIRDFASQSYID